MVAYESFDCITINNVDVSCLIHDTIRIKYAERVNIFVVKKYYNKNMSRYIHVKFAVHERQLQDVRKHRRPENTV